MYWLGMNRFWEYACGMKRLKHIALVVAAAFLSAFILFLPSLDALGGDKGSLLQNIAGAFFQTTDPEPLFGDGVDPLGSFWIVDFVERILWHGESAYTRTLYAPYGLDLGLHEGYAWLDTLFAMPLMHLVGMPGFFNLHVLCSLVLSFAGCYLFFHHLSGHRGAALVLAHLCVVNQFVYQEISFGRPTQVNWLFGALFALFCVRMLESKSSWGPPALAGLCLGAMCLTYWFSAAAVAFGMGLVLLAGHAHERRWFLALRNATLLFAGTAIVVLPVCWRVVQPILAGKGSKSYSKMLEDPVAMFELWGFKLPLYGTDYVTDLDSLWTFLMGRHYPLSLLAGALIVVPAAFAFRKRIWLWGALPALLLPIGSSLQWNGTVIPTTFALLEQLFPPLVRCNFPDRLMMAPMLLVLGIIAAAWPQLQDRLHGRRWMQALPIASLVLLVGNASWVLSSHTPRVQSFSVNRALVKTAKKKPGGFIEFPFEMSNSTYVQSAFHRQQLLTGPGMMTVQPRETTVYLQRNAVLADLEKLDASGYTPAMRWKEREMLELHKDGFRHLVLYTDEIEKPVKVFERYLRTKGEAFPEYGVHIIELPGMQ
jgi:hypothetical protein